MMPDFLFHFDKRPAVNISIEKIVFVFRKQLFYIFWFTDEPDACPNDEHQYYHLMTIGQRQQQQQQQQQ